MTDEQLHALWLTHADYDSDGVNHYPSADSIIAFGRSLIAAEREGCAVDCDDQIEEWEGEDPRAAARACAATIRARQG